MSQSICGNKRGSSSRNNEQTDGPRSKKERKSSNNCHQHHKNEEGPRVRCNKCGKQYCPNCITKWYCALNEMSFIEACAMCRNICNCGACLQSKKYLIDLKLSPEDKLYHSRHIISELLPSLKKYVLDHNVEREVDAKIQVADGQVKKLLLEAETVNNLETNYVGQRVSETCSYSTPREASREHTCNNYLNCPLDLDAGKPDLRHFQLHFSRGEPVVVGNVISEAYGLSWEPQLMTRAVYNFMKKEWLSQAKQTQDVDLLGAGISEGVKIPDMIISVRNYGDWCQEDISVANFFEGYIDCVSSAGSPKILRLESWPLSQERLPRHLAEGIKCLPFKHYTHPSAGNLNMAARKIPEMSTGDFGMKLYFTYGRESYPAGNLQFAVSDRVDILMHIQSAEAEYGNFWDIFRRQDVPKLEDYLRKHATEFGHIFPPHHMMYTIHEQKVHLTPEHIQQLKAEYGIEPWSIVQKLGDAVFIPAGCPYQMRNSKSCTNVVVNFLAPESVAECIRLAEQFPDDHPDKLQLNKLTYHVVRRAIDDLGKITLSPPVGEQPPTHDFMKQRAQLMKLCLDKKGYKITDGVKREELKCEIENFLKKNFPNEGSSSSFRGPI